MTTLPIRQRTLAEFLQLPEIQPAAEFVAGEIIQKPMPQGKHSRLQSKICEHVNRCTEPDEIALALPELRCSFNGRSIVPDVAIFRWARIPFTGNGEVLNTFSAAPDWMIEILSPERSKTKVIDKLVFCIEQGTELGWLIDPDERAVIGYQPDRLPRIYRGADPLPVLSGLDWQLTVDRVFGWLRIGKSAN
jgi:Uma2 family endonuclease